MSFLIAIVGGFSGGVLLRSIFVFGWPLAAFVFVVGAIALMAYWVVPRRAYALAAAFLFLCALGVFRTDIADTPPPLHFAAHLDTKVSYEGVVVSDPDVRDAHQRVAIRIGDDTTTIILAVADRYPVVGVGERVQVTGLLTLPEPFTTEDGSRLFRYDKFLQKDGIRFLINNATLTTLERAPWYSVAALLARVKHTFLSGLSAALPEPHASLAGGIVIGGKTGLGSELKDAFIVTGLVQIIVLSGYNVMIVAEWVMYLLGLFKLRRGWSSLAGVFAIVLFVAIAGASSTAVRAASMALIALYARATGRTYAASHALLVIVLLMLVWNPLLLAFDPGFGLSVAATAGLIWLTPLLEFKFSRVPIAFWRDIFATTVAAQIAVLPLLLYQMGLLSLVAIPANLLIAAVMPFAMGLAALAGLAGVVLGHQGWLIALPAYILTTYIIAIAEGGRALPFAALQIPALPFAFVFAAYAALIYLVARKRSLMTFQLTFSKKAST